jgi:hypothetical protein
MSNASTALRDDVLQSPMRTSTLERSTADALQDCYAQTGICEHGTLLSQLLQRIKEDEPGALLMAQPATLKAAAKWLEALREAMWSQGSTLILGTGGNSPSATWISEHGEVVLEWSAPGRRLSFYLHVNYTSAVISAMVKGNPVSQHVDAVTAEVAAVMLMSFQGRA